MLGYVEQTGVPRIYNLLAAHARLAHTAHALDEEVGAHRAQLILFHHSAHGQTFTYYCARAAACILAGRLHQLAYIYAQFLHLAERAFHIYIDDYASEVENEHLYFIVYFCCHKLMCMIISVQK
jgi:hypothetical protein